MVLSRLARGGTVVTANARATRALLRACTRAQSTAGRGAWRTPAIYEWESWLDLLWKQHLLSAPTASLLLSHLQERAVWKRIVGDDFGDLESVAMLALNAWNLLSDFEAHEDRRRPWQAFATSDAESFRVWANAFDRECRNQDWMSRSDLPALLTGSIERGQIRLPAEILWVGFDRTTPAQQRWITAAKNSGSLVDILVTPESLTVPQIIAASDLRDELFTCAWWLRRRIDADPGAHIAVIAQDLNGMRMEIDRTFRKILAPESVGIESQEALPYEFSLVAPWRTFPLSGRP